MSKTVCLDFNGVLDTYAGTNRDHSHYTYPMRNGARQFLLDLKSAGYKIVIQTFIDPAGVREWLVDKHVSELVDDVTNIKPAADVYVDDKAICFSGNFSDTLEKISSFVPFWAERKKE